MSTCLDDLAVCLYAINVIFFDILIFFAFDHCQDEFSRFGTYDPASIGLRPTTTRGPTALPSAEHAREWGAPRPRRAVRVRLEDLPWLGHL